MKLNRASGGAAPQGMIAGTVLAALQNDSAVTVNRAAWDGAFARCEAAKRAANEFSRTVFDPAFEKAKALGQHVAFELLEREEELTDAWGDLEMILLAIPAPDVKALLWKLSATCGQCWPAEVTNCLMADIARLIGEA